MTNIRQASFVSVILNLKKEASYIYYYFLLIMSAIPKTVVCSVIELLKSGKSTREIAKYHNISQPTVQRIKNKCSFPIIKNKGGRKKKLSAIDTRKVIRYLMYGEASSASEAALLLKQDTGKSVSKWTILRALHISGFRAVERKKSLSFQEKILKLENHLLKTIKNGLLKNGTELFGRMRQKLIDLVQMDVGGTGKDSMKLNNRRITFRQ